MHSLFIAIAIFYVYGVPITYVNALGYRNSALRTYNNVRNHPSLYTEKDKEEALADLRAAQKLKSQSLVFFIPLVKFLFDYVKSLKKTDKTVKSLLAERE